MKVYSSSYPPVLGGYYLNLRENGDVSPCLLLWPRKLDSVVPGEGGRSEIAQEGSSILAIEFHQDFASCSSLGPLQTEPAGLWLPELPAQQTPCHMSTPGSCLPGTQREVSARLRVGQVSLWVCQQAEGKGSTGGSRISSMDGLEGEGY